jgi:chromosome partitioning protein
MRTIAVVNQKGGCGKTTISINLASALAELGKKTLLVDMDPQSHCAVGLAVPEEQIEQSIYDVLISKSRNEPIKLTEILWQISDRLDLAPASIDLSAFEQQMAGVAEREGCLRDVLGELKGEFEYVVVDCPPAVGLLTFNALRAATDVVVPVETGYFSLHGLSKQLETLNILCQRCGQQINVRVVASMYDIRTKMAREIMAELRSCFGERMFKTIVNFNTKLKEAASFGQPIGEYDSASKGRSDFIALAEEVVACESMQQRRELVNSLSSQLDDISSSADELLKSTKPAEAIEEPIVDEPAVEKESPAQTEPVAIVKPVSTNPPADRAEEQSESESFETAEALEPAEEIIEVEPEVPAEPVSTEEKLSDYYGVSQMNAAVVFVTLYPRASKVQIAGDFNNWQPEKTEMQKVGDSGIWQTQLNLPPGKHQYRLVVDGHWQQDPYNEQTELNPFGGFNSVVEVE